MKQHRPPISLSRLIVLLILCTTTIANAYKMGDPIHTLMYTEKGTTDVMRSQVPLFGTTRTVQFRAYDREFSLGFEQGMWTIPWIQTTARPRERLEKIVIQFVYSSNSGTIHSISKKVVYAKNEAGMSNRLSQIPVEYVWVKEEPVDLQAGTILMFLATLVTSIVFFIQACNVADGDYDPQSDTDKRSGSRASIGKGM